MLTKTSAELKVNSQKEKLVLMFGSDWLKTDGSTSAGPGFRKNCNGAPWENQMRPPAMCGVVA